MREVDEGRVEMSVSEDELRGEIGGEGEAGAKRLVSEREQGEGLREGVRITVREKSEQEGDVVGRAVGLKPVDEPHPLLTAR
jgi:hypothetical protein